MAGFMVTLLFLALFGLCGVVQGSRDDWLTADSKDWAEKHGQSTYHDYSRNCTRSTSTGEKCIKLYGLDVDGKPFTYVATKPAFGPQRIKDIKYLDPRDGDVVKVKPGEMEDWKRRGQI